MLIKSIKEESLHIARLIINNRTVRYCGVCLGINGTWCGSILRGRPLRVGTSLCLDKPLILSLERVSKYAN